MIKIENVSSKKKNSVRGSIFTGGTGGTHIREINDFYATKGSTVKKLLDVFPLEGSIYECAAGQGHIVDVLKEYYPNNEIICSDLIDRGYIDCESNVDFLTKKYDRTFDNIITNPPFKHAKEFVEKSLELSNQYVIMLLKVQFLESKARKEFLKNSPLKYVYVFSERQSTMRDGNPINPDTNKPWSSTMLLCWFVWEKGYTGEPIIRWL